MQAQFKIFLRLISWKEVHSHPPLVRLRAQLKATMPKPRRGHPRLRDQGQARPGQRLKQRITNLRACSQRCPAVDVIEAHSGWYAFRHSFATTAMLSYDSHAGVEHQALRIILRVDVAIGPERAPPLSFAKWTPGLLAPGFLRDSSRVCVSCRGFGELQDDRPRVR